MNATAKTRCLMRMAFTLLVLSILLSLSTMAAVQAATFSVTLTPGATMNPLSLNLPGTQNFTATLSGVLANGQEVQFVANSENWTWSIAPTGDDQADHITYNATSVAGLSSLPSSWGSAGVVDTDPSGPPSSTGSQGTLTVTANQPGYYHIPVVASVDFAYINPVTGVQFGHAYGVCSAVVVVQLGNFTLSSTPGSVTLPEGGNDSGTNNGGPVNIITTSQNGMAGAVALSLGNAPNGVAGQFNPNSSVNLTSSLPTDRSHMISIFVGTGVPVGKYALHITGDWTPNPSLDISYYSPLNLTVQKPGVYLTCAQIEPSVSKSGPDVRNADGSITVDSLGSSDSLANGSWFGPGGDSLDNGVTLVANPTVYQDSSDSWSYRNPVYTWFAPSSSSGLPTVKTQSELGPSAPQETQIYYNVGLGPYAAANTPATTSVGLTITDNLPLENVSASNTYTIRWHKFIENLGSPIAVPNNDYISPFTRIDLNTTQSVTIPGSEADATFGATGQAQTVGLIVGIGGALIPFAELSAPATYVIQAMCAGTSYQLSLTPEQQTSETITATADYAEWCADINKQVQDNNSRSPDVIRFTPANVANLIQAQLQLNANGSPNTAAWTSDPYFCAATAEWRPGRYGTNYYRYGDGYGVHGYTGSVPTVLHVQSNYYRLFLWTTSYKLPQKQ